MKNANVEIYSDATNMAVMRHPGRRVPGVLVQGDTLFGIVQELGKVLSEKDKLSEDTAVGLGDLYELLSGMLKHYSAVLDEHGMDLPFYSPKK
jgi:hypothetical protein